MGGSLPDCLGLLLSMGFAEASWCDIVYTEGFGCWWLSSLSVDVTHSKRMSRQQP